MIERGSRFRELILRRRALATVGLLAIALAFTVPAPQVAGGDARPCPTTSKEFTKEFGADKSRWRHSKDGSWITTNDTVINYPPSGGAKIHPSPQDPSRYVIFEDDRGRYRILMGRDFRLQCQEAA